MVGFNFFFFIILFFVVKLWRQKVMLPRVQFGNFVYTCSRLAVTKTHSKYTCQTNLYICIIHWIYTIRWRDAIIHSVYCVFVGFTVCKLLTRIFFTYRENLRRSVWMPFFYLFLLVYFYLLMKNYNFIIRVVIERIFCHLIF